MKAIKNLIITLVIVVAILGVVIIGGYIYVRTAYGIDLFRTAGQLKNPCPRSRRNNALPERLRRQRFCRYENRSQQKA